MLCCVEIEEVGLAELTAQAWSGFAFHRRQSEALHRYRMLSRSTWPRWTRSPALGLTRILADQGISQKVRFASASFVYPTIASTHIFVNFLHKK